MESLRLYPNSPSNKLREFISSLHGLRTDQVIVGNGSDDLLNLCTRCFSDDSLKVGMLEPSYSLYEVIASLQDSTLIRIPFSDDTFSLDPQEVIDSGANLFFITSPHAPSGREYPLDCFRQILKEFQGILVIDEAYADFAEQNALPLLGEFSNLILTRTMSKSYSLAGLRVGYALASPELVSILDQAREVYNVDRLAQAAALAGLKDRTYFEQTRDSIVKEERNSPCSWTNGDGKPAQAEPIFYLPCPLIPKGGRALSGHGPLRLPDLENVLIRYFPKHELTSSYLRISIGNASDMNILMERIIEWKTQE